MADVIFALDPGITTGWAIIRKQDRAVLGMGDLSSEEVGCGVDLLVRSMHRLDYRVVPVVEEMPEQGGVSGDLAIELKFVRRTISHWLEDVFELDVTYVLPGTWKTSRVAATTKPPAEFEGRPLSPHMRDAYTMGTYVARKR